MNYADLIISAARAEILLLILACALLAGDLFIPPNRRAIIHYAAIASLLLCAAVVSFDFADELRVALNGFFVASPMADTLKITVFLSSAGALAYSREYLSNRGMMRGELHSLALFATLGMSVMISANHFLSLYLGLELLSLSLYAMIALRRDDRSATESAMKYFVLGALSSGLLLYGISMIYGATGELEIPKVAAKIVADEIAGREVLVFGLVFLVAGIAFKLGAAPFHMWLPDVYHGAPTAMTLFIGAAPKVAAFAMTVRILAEAMGRLSPDWGAMLAVVAVASLAVGNITAIAQTNIKRMLAYSAIAHMGFLLLGVLSDSADGYAAAMFYVIAYALMTLAGFGMVVILSRGREEADGLDDLKGLASRNGFCALLLLLLMFSMAGVPPVIGFYAKLAVLQAVVAAGEFWLAVIAVLLSVVGAFYYLRVIKLMYFDKPEKNAGALSLSRGALLLAGVNGFLILWLGVFPGALMSLCERAVRLSM